MTIDSIKIKQAVDIAKRDLRACYIKPGIVAGLDHFDDYWARDSFFASWGALSIGDTEIVKSNLDLFYRFQKKSGLIPRRINRYWLIRFKYILGIRIRRSKLSPVYVGHNFAPNIDPNSLFVITAEKYFLKTNNKEYLIKIFPALTMAMQWLNNMDKNSDGLIEEGVFANWIDSVHKEGATLYAQVLAYMAFQALFRISSEINKPIPEDLSLWGKMLSKNINKLFWNGKYFSDWIKNGRRYDYFSFDGNLLAILSGFAAQEQIETIIKSVKSFYGEFPIPTPTNFPSYPWYRVAIRNHLAGLSGYQNASARWLWLSALAAVAMEKSGERGEALEQMEKMAELIIRYGTVFEIYKPDNSSYGNIFWRNEVPFAWSAGMFLWAADQLDLIDKYAD